MARRRLWRWTRRGLIGVSFLLMALAVVSWVRSYRLIDRVRWGRLRFGETPMTGPPRGMWRMEADPPGTVWWEGQYREWRVDVFNGHVLLRLGHRPWYATSRTRTPRSEGWHREVGDIGDSISYNIPRGNVWLSRDDFHWNGIGTWPYYINGDAAQYVMLPHWLLVSLCGVPCVVWGGVAGRMRWRTGARRRAGRCVVCGYQLGKGVGKCPECGSGA